MNYMKKIFLCSLILFALTGCNKKADQEIIEESVTPVNNCPTCDFPDTAWVSHDTGPKLVFKFVFDSTQARLNNTGAAATIASGNAGQSPRVNGMSAHYLELAQNDLTQVGQGTVLYKADETSCGGDKAIVFCKSVVCKNGDVFFSIPFSKIAAGSYKWLRVSLAYQNYDIRVKTNSTGVIDGTLASFVGFNTYVTKYKMKGVVMTPTISGGPGNKAQGYWGFFTNIFNVNFKTEGQAAQTTVVNPNPASAIPPGSCLVTGEFFKTGAGVVQPLVITGNENQDLVINVSLSTNKSFEWKELNADGLFQPDVGETVVDMGLRGMIPKY
jgi:hypothetical protein